MNDPHPSPLPTELADDHEIRLCCRCGNSVQIEPRISLADVESLRTGALLEPTDVAHARELTERRISSVDDVITSLHKVLTELEEHKRRLLRRVDVQKAYVAPIRRLPAELLSEIFYHCCRQFDDITSRSSCMPLVLGAVCKRWHDIAHDTPRLWTDVRMSKGQSGGNKIRPEILRARLQLYLRNSKGLPFSDAVQYYSRLNSKSSHAVAFPLLLQHAERWTSVDISHFGFSEATQGIAFPRLHTVTGDGFGTAFIEPEGPMLQHAPALRRAILRDIDEHGSVPILPWTQFEWMQLKCSASFALQCLSQCSALATLEFTPTPSSPQLLPATVHLPSLRHLHLTICQSTAWYNSAESVTMTFMKAFVTARLQLLSIAWSSYGYRSPKSDPAEDGDALAVFYARTQPPLHELSLCHPHAPARDWAFSITSLQILKLDLGYSAPFDDDCAMLLATADAGVPRLLPHLETLHLKGHLRVTAASLLQMVEARADRGLRNLHLDIRSANMDRLGKPEIFDLIQQAMPAAVIEGVDALVKHIEERDRRNELELQFLGQDQEWIDEYIRNRDKQAYER